MMNFMDADPYNAQYCNSKTAFVLCNLFVAVVELTTSDFPTTLAHCTLCSAPLNWPTSALANLYEAILGPSVSAFFPSEGSPWSVSTVTKSWSDIWGSRETFKFFTIVSLLVKTRSRICSFRVGSVTSCCRKYSWASYRRAETDAFSSVLPDAAIVCPFSALCQVSSVCV
jgi:hypothetical protein